MAIGTTAYPGEEQPVPWFDFFIKHVVEDEGHISGNDLYLEYIQFVKLTVEHKEGGDPKDMEEEVRIATKTRFLKIMKRHVRLTGIQMYDHSPRGYYVRVNKLPGRTDAAVVNSPNTQDTNIKIVQCPGKKGRGCFAVRDLPEGLTLCEYKGKRMSLEEGEQKDEEYRAARKCPTMLWEVGDKFCVDGYTKENGDPFGEEENVAAILNHRLHNPNVELYWEGHGRQGKQFYLRTRRPVAQGFELCWNYGDKRRGLEAFMYDQ